MQTKDKVAARIMALFPDFSIKRYTDKRGKMQLLVSNPLNGKSLRIKIKDSKNYLTDSTTVDESIHPYLKYTGWFLFDSTEEIYNTAADLWILVWPDNTLPIHALLLPFADLAFVLEKCSTTRNEKSTGAEKGKDFYWYIRNNDTSFAARPLGLQQIKDILEDGERIDPSLLLDSYVDAWQKYIGDVLN